MTLTESTTTAEPLPAEAAPPKPRLSPRQIASRVAAVLFAVGITFLIFFFAPQIRRFQELGYLGVFLINLIASASVILPIPGLGITFVSSAVLYWPLVGLASGLGQALGETTGYLAGFGGGAIFENNQLYQRLQYWMENHGFLTILILSAIPNPLFDMAGMTAGALKYPYYKFFLAALIGKTIKSLIFAWAGAHSVGWAAKFF